MINKFVRQYRFLSNFYPSEVYWEGIKYPSVEHAYQSAKTISPFDKRVIELCKTPGEAKRYGGRVHLRKGWENIKLFIMEDLVNQKFKNPKLQQLLFATGNEELIEGNDWGDTFWGVCNSVGQNHLGKILMAVRDG